MVAGNIPNMGPIIPMGNDPNVLQSIHAGNQLQTQRDTAVYNAQQQKEIVSMEQQGAMERQLQQQREQELERNFQRSLAEFNMQASERMLNLKRSYDVSDRDMWIEKQDAYQKDKMSYDQELLTNQKWMNMLTLKMQLANLKQTGMGQEKMQKIMQTLIQKGEESTNLRRDFETTLSRAGTAADTLDFDPLVVPVDSMGKVLPNLVDGLFGGITKNATLETLEGDSKALEALVAQSRGTDKELGAAHLAHLGTVLEGIQSTITQKITDKSGDASPTGKVTLARLRDARARINKAALNLDSLISSSDPYVAQLSKRAQSMRRGGSVGDVLRELVDKSPAKTWDFDSVFNSLNKEMGNIENIPSEFRDVFGIIQSFGGR